MTTSSSFQRLQNIIKSDDVVSLTQAGKDIETAAQEKDINGRGLLHAAVHDRADDCLLFLIDKRAVSLDAQDVQGETALMRAASLGNTTAVKGLLEAGASTQVQAHTGGTALHYAYAGGKAAEAVIQILVDAGMNSDAEDKSGRKPAAWAAEAKAIEAGAALRNPPTPKVLSLRKPRP